MPVFLFTDIEGSTKKWEKFGDYMVEILKKHDSIISGNISKYGGRIIKHTGDGVFAVFEEGDPLTCSIEIQKQLGSENWGDIGELRVRMALHSGKATKSGEDYFGNVINKTARILSIGYGGQILFTWDVMDLARMPTDATFKNHGFHLLKDLNAPKEIFGLIHPDLPLKEFPNLKSLSKYPNNLPLQ
jgi:class 3 adenylate cyclase